MKNNFTVLTKLFMTFKDDNKDRLNVYFEVLKDIPTELLAKAVMKCITTCKFLPSVAEILEECESITETITGKPKVKDWDEAWMEIYKNWCDGSPYKPKPNWSTPEIALTVESFGWLNLLEAQSDQTQTIRAQMKALYETACKRKLKFIKNTNILQGKSGFEGIGSIMPRNLEEIEGGLEK